MLNPAYGSGVSARAGDGIVVAIDWGDGEGRGLSESSAGVSNGSSEVWLPHGLGREVSASSGITSLGTSRAFVDAFLPWLACLGGGMGAEDADDTENLDDTVAAGGTTVGADLVVYAGGAVDGMDALDGTAGAAESCSVVAAGGQLAPAIDFVGSKLEELETGLENDADAVVGLRDGDVRKDEGEAKCVDRKSTRLNSSHSGESRMPSSA